MSESFFGEIRMFGGNYAPSGWAICDGQLLPISQNEALFSLLGTTYGGDGQTTFALPDLRGRIPIHYGTGPGLQTRVLGEMGGQETVALLATQMPAHTHGIGCSTGGGAQVSPAGNFWASEPNAEAAAFTAAVPNANMSSSAIGAIGGSQPHNNMQPFLCVSFIVSLFGVFPSRN
ncbi:MAG TPA: phage tail protein, partial [Solibacterales bacterium]|nr:phage tail protein [Bryobacterales bacterium]